jgi:hypothetical protein
MMRSSSGPKKERIVRRRVRLTSVRDGKTANKSKRLTCPYCDSMDVRPSYLTNLAEKANRKEGVGSRESVWTFGASVEFSQDLVVGDIKSTFDMTERNGESSFGSART